RAATCTRPIPAPRARQDFRIRSARPSTSAIRATCAGWKAMPSDLSSPRLGERSLKLIDDMSNWGLHKRLLGEVDVFQLDSTHELYAHMNINYVRAPRLPDYAHYGELMDSLAHNDDNFITTGEVLLPEVKLGKASIHAKIGHTFPLRMAEVVWGDGEK